MPCEHTADCVYYRTHQYKSSSRQFRLLVDSYCEGDLHPLCRRRQYSIEHSEEVPDGMAPNGYLVGTHKKIMTDNVRKFVRHRVKNGVCLLQALDNNTTFSAEILDISQGGMRLELDLPPEELKICLEDGFLKILRHSLEDIPFPLSKEFIKMVWQNNRVVGCSFAEPSLAL